MKISNYAKIALFFVILGGAGAGYIVMSSNGVSGLNTRNYEVVLSDASGLSTRSKVYLAGVAVGQVSEITLEGSEAHLKIAFLKDVEIRRDATLARRSSSLLGTSVLALEPGSAAAPPLPPGGRITADKRGGGMEEVMETVQDLGGQVSGLLDEFQKNQMTLLAVSLETFNSIAQKIDARADAELDRVSRILEAAALISEQAEALFRDKGDDIGGSVEEIRGALENIRHITGEIRSGQGNLGQTIYDDRLYLRLLSTVEKTGETADKLTEALGSIDHLAKNIDGVVDTAAIVVEKAAGLGISVDTNARYDFLAAGARASASIRLEPRSNDRWYRIGVSSAPFGVPRRTITETLDNNGNLIRYRDTTETKFPVSIDAELARSIGMFTLHGGLLESTAGVGLDFQPLSWLSLSGEVFNFSSGNAPNLRGSLTFYPFFDPDSDKPWNWLYLRGGITNAINGDRDFFLGGGLRFRDREVKGLIGLLPALN
ncbi:MAG: MlaD family protein [Treponema sp.]|jgi:phospholipid/cholesterol/gamma-HCH transport system substrate-binding protein|nr:MlaD family protein [Treponema sp.]